MKITENDTCAMARPLASLLVSIFFIHIPTIQCAGVIGGLVAENSLLNLTCKAGTGTMTITFADYGTPGGSCGDYTHGGCTLSTAIDTVKGLCEGKSSCVINATNDVFGKDPCYVSPCTAAWSSLSTTLRQSHSPLSLPPSLSLSLFFFRVFLFLSLSLVSLFL